jgi:Calcineurin-like phosphoesterase
MMTTLYNHVKTFDGMLVFADVHGDYESFKRAYDYARSENFFFMSLGDLVDRGRNPYEVVSAMYECMYEGRGGFTVGNHDEKHHRAGKGNKVSFSRDAKTTLSDVGEDRMAEFVRMYAAINEDKLLSGLFHTFDDLTLVHAASHPCIWEGVTEVGKTARSRFLVGETNGKTDSDGYPVRLYNWIAEVPMGKTVMVGHDHHPVHNVRITEPMVVTNKNGGKAIFLDTGCGKGGFLSGAVILHDKKGFKFDRFMEFK